MPIYEYACLSCEHQFETIQRFAEDPLKDCPECGKAELKKLVSVAAFRLKGGGWYETDFKSGDKKNIAGDKKKNASEKSDEAGSSKSEATSDASDASKTDVAKDTGKSESPADSTKKAEPKASREPKGGSSKNTSSSSSGSD